MVRLIKLYAILQLAIGICLIEAADEHNSSRNPNESQPSESPMQRWDQIHRLLYDDLEEEIQPETVQKLLEEMLVIEKSSAFYEAAKETSTISDTKPTTRLARFKLLEMNVHHLKLFGQPGSGLTATLLESFNPSSNNCSEEYFNRFVSLSSEIDSMTLYLALLQNREMKYKHCWSRYMKALESASELMGTIELGNLRQLYRLINPSVPRPTPSISSEMQSARISNHDYDQERYSRSILELLLANEGAQWTHDHDEQYDLVVRKPCKLLNSLTSDITNRINSFLTFIIDRRDFIEDSHYELIQLTKMCSNIIAEPGLRIQTLFLLKNPDFFHDDTEPDYSEDVLKTLEDHNAKLEETSTQYEIAIRDALNQSRNLIPKSSQASSSRQLARLRTPQMLSRPMPLITQQFDYSLVPKSVPTDIDPSQLISKHLHDIRTMDLRSVLETAPITSPNSLESVEVPQEPLRAQQPQLQEHQSQQLMSKAKKGARIRVSDPKIISERWKDFDSSGYDLILDSNDTNERQKQREQLHDQSNSGSSDESRKRRKKD